MAIEITLENYTSFWQGERRPCYQSETFKQGAYNATMSYSVLQSAKLALEISRIQRQNEKYIASILGSVYNDINSVQSISVAMQSAAAISAFNSSIAGVSSSVMSVVQQGIGTSHRAMVEQINGISSVYQRIIEQISLDTQLSLSRTVQDAIEHALQRQRIEFHQFNLPSYLVSMQVIGFGNFFDRIYVELAASNAEAIAVEELDEAASSLIQGFTVGLLNADSTTKLTELVASIDGRLSALANPVRKTVFLVLLMLLSNYLTEALTTWWASYIEDTRTHLIEYSQGVEALQAAAKRSPRQSIEQVSGLIRMPCIAMSSNNGLIRYKLTVGTPVKITQRNGRSVEIRWFEGEQRCRGWIDMKYIGFPKRFR